MKKKLATMLDTESSNTVCASQTLVDLYLTTCMDEMCSVTVEGQFLHKHLHTPWQDEMCSVGTGM
jgi:hypothetical protein